MSLGNVEKSGYFLDFEIGAGQVGVKSGRFPKGAGQRVGVQQALERLIVGRTTIIIAHRLSTIRNADKIVVLEGKQIAEAGTHEQLMRNDGLYRRLYAVQYQLEVQPLRPVN